MITGTATTACTGTAADGTLLAAEGLLAAGGWEQVIIAIVAIGIWAVNQFLGARNKGAPPARRNLPPVPRQGQQGAGQAAGGQKGLLDEVEQFLKDARKQMEQQRPQPQQRPEPRIQPPPMPQQAARRQKQQPKGKQKAGRPLARPLSETRPLDNVQLGTSVEQHVREHLGTERFDTSGFDERAGKLSQLQQTIDQDIGSHVRSVFDHQLGTIVSPDSSLGTAPADTAAAPTPAQQLVAMLRDPQGIRNAVLLQEIFRPPLERW